MKIAQIREYLGETYTRIEPFPAMFILNNFDGLATTKEICDTYVVDMYIVKGLTYITLEKEDPSLTTPNILKVFSYARGLDFPSPKFIDDLVQAKYGKRFRFFGDKDSLNTILAWQSPGIWKTGVQFLQYELDHDFVDDIVVRSAVEFSENFAQLVSSITIQDLWLLKSRLKGITINQAMTAYQNLQSQHFEMCLQELLRSKFGFIDVVTRYKPPYLKGKEIDVYAKKGRIGEPKTVTICECKLRFSDAEIQPEEVINFIEVAPKVEQHEMELTCKEGGSVRINLWLVTNAAVSSRAVEDLHRHGIEIMIAALPSNWRERGDWKIVKITSL